jgi:hypothetical protein
MSDGLFDGLWSDACALALVSNNSRARQYIPTSCRPPWPPRNPGLSFSRLTLLFEITRSVAEMREREMHVSMDGSRECFFACVGTMTGLTSSQPKHAITGGGCRRRHAWVTAAC